jgi:hypothetical protein
VIEAYLVLAARIRAELDDLESVLDRAERAISAGHKQPQDLDLFIDAAALNLHAFYAGLERIFRLIAATVDGSVPTGQEWHRELLRQMTVDLPDSRPPAITENTASVLDDLLRFRHVVRNIYTFSLIPDQIERLVQQAHQVYLQVRAELLSFAEFLEQVGRD